MKEYLLKDLFEPPISGVWGNELTEGQKGIKVLRTTNFTNDGRINYDEVVERDIDLKDDRKILRKHDIIIEKSGGGPEQPVGRVVFLNKETDLENEVYVCNNFTAILRPRQGFNKKYLFYILMNLYNRGVVLKFQNKTTGISNLKLKDYLKTTKVNIPNIQTQQKIADVLDKAQFLIDKRKEQIKECDRLIESLFYDMFGDPVMNSKEWRKAILSEICDVRDGTHDSPKYIGEGYPLVTSKNIVNGKIDLTNVNFISYEDYMEINKRSKVDIGDIIMPMIGTIGNPAIVESFCEFAIKNLALIKCNDKCVNNIFLKILLKSKFLEIEIIKKSRGGTQKFLSLGDIRNLKIPLPPLDLQKEFADKVQKIEQQKQLLEKSLALMEDNFNSLMQKAFRGELF